MQHRLHMLLVAPVGINVPHVRSASSAGRHRRVVIGAECLTQAASGPAAFTLHFHVQRFAACTCLVEVEQPFAICRPLMDEIYPREIIEMPVLARHHEAGRKHERGFALCRAVVNITSPVGSIRRLLWLEQTGANRGQQPALRANHPAGKWGYWHADLPRLIEPVGLGSLRFRPTWWRQKASNL